MATRVIGVRGEDREALEACPDFVYCGRKCHGWPASIWGNPFRTARTFEGCLRAAIGEVREGDHADPESEMVRAAFHVMARRLPELRGKILGCWCGSWMPGRPEIPCHAVALAKLADAIREIDG